MFVHLDYHPPNMKYFFYFHALRFGHPKFSANLKLFKNPRNTQLVDLTLSVRSNEVPKKTYVEIEKFFLSYVSNWMNFLENYQLVDQHIKSTQT